MSLPTQTPTTSRSRVRAANHGAAPNAGPGGRRGRRQRHDRSGAARDHPTADKTRMRVDTLEQLIRRDGPNAMQ